MADKKRLILLLKIALSLGALVYVFSRVGPRQLLHTLADTEAGWLVGALLAFNLSKIVASVRLNRFFAAIGVRLSEAEALRLYYIGMFYNLFLPGGIGGDGYKIYLLKRHREADTAPLIAATLLDRISGLASLLFFAGVLFLFSRYAALYPWARPLDWAGLVLVYPVTWLLYRRGFRPVFRTTAWLGAVTQLLQLLSAWMLALALGLQGHLIEVLTLFLLSSVAAVLPLSVGGVGIREFVFLYGFQLLGLDTARGVAFSVLFFLITAVSSFTGLFLRHGLDEERDVKKRRSSVSKR
ncbi:lysylphosphatidylglycerol synthase transmembrane domain-containing protein [Nitratifractor sp.]|uniref:lysylphosphatidylglycerol synthase transmembrane domain-containing protein n=1 Tax=Nitratifractor sp. TaxID=2268144 RepID=UPI0025F1C726|nr:lysylphosphatidylglycerol synthase transmembrane domain-containing protein [Nitratifractor sp.]